MSEDTIGDSEYSKIFFKFSFSDWFLTNSFRELISIDFSSSTNKSTADPSGTGTLHAIPSNFPSSSGKTFPTALAAPVDVGIIFSAAARDLLKSLCGTSANLWSFV